MSDFDLISVDATEPVFGIQLGPVILRTHPPEKCAGETCCIHNPSEHHIGMRHEYPVAGRWRRCGDRPMSEPLGTRTDLGWIERAECGPDTAEVFHQASQEQQQHGYSRQRAIQIALSICGRCEVREECYRYMLEQPELTRAGTVAAGLVWDSKGRPGPPRRLPGRACGYCGATFVPLYPLNRYCSRTCQGKARRVRNPVA